LQAGTNQLSFGRRQERTCFHFALFVLCYGDVPLKHATPEEGRDFLFEIFEEWEFGRAKVGAIAE
jgi:hypothetical protein